MLAIQAPGSEGSEFDPQVPAIVARAWNGSAGKTEASDAWDHWLTKLFFWGVSLPTERYDPTQGNVMVLGMCSSGNKDADGEIGLRPSSDSIIQLRIWRSQCVDVENAFLLIRGERMTQVCSKCQIGFYLGCQDLRQIKALFVFVFLSPSESLLNLYSLFNPALNYVGRMQDGWRWSRWWQY